MAVSFSIDDKNDLVFGSNQEGRVILCCDNKNLEVTLNGYWDSSFEKVYKFKNEKYYDRALESVPLDVYSTENYEVDWEDLKFDFDRALAEQERDFSPYKVIYGPNDFLCYDELNKHNNDVYEGDVLRFDDKNNSVSLIPIQESYELNRLECPDWKEFKFSKEEYTDLKKSIKTVNEQEGQVPLLSIDTLCQETVRNRGFEIYGLKTNSADKIVDIKLDGKTNRYQLSNLQMINLVGSYERAAEEGKHVPFSLRELDIACKRMVTDKNMPFDLALSGINKDYNNEFSYKINVYDGDKLSSYTFGNSYSLPFKDEHGINYKIMEDLPSKELQDWLSVASDKPWRIREIPFSVVNSSATENFEREDGSGYTSRLENIHSFDINDPSYNEVYDHYCFDMQKSLNAGESISSAENKILTEMVGSNDFFADDIKEMLAETSPRCIGKYSQERADWLVEQAVTRVERERDTRNFEVSQCSADLSQPLSCKDFYLASYKENISKEQNFVKAEFNTVTAMMEKKYPVDEIKQVLRECSPNCTFNEKMITLDVMIAGSRIKEKETKEINRKQENLRSRTQPKEKEVHNKPKEQSTKKNQNSGSGSGHGHGHSGNDGR